MSANCHPRNIIRPASGKVVERFRNGDTRDIITVILDTDANADRYVNAEGLECLLGATEYDTLRNVWRFVKSNVRYRADKAGHEVVKTPGALFHAGVGDCKSFSIAEAAILRALGFRGIRYRFVAYRPGDFTHVYVVAKLRGKDVILDAVHTHFDEEAPIRIIRRRDFPAPGHSAGVSGLPHVGGDIQNFMRIGGLLAAVYAFYLFTK